MTNPRIENFFKEVTALSYPATHPLLKEACEIINELTAKNSAPVSNAVELAKKALARCKKNEFGWEAYIVIPELAQAVLDLTERVEFLSTQNEALMRERANYIQTHREHANRLEERVEELEGALIYYEPERFIK